MTEPTLLFPHSQDNDNDTASSSSSSRPLRVACLGGGQLGRMMALEAPRLGIHLSFLDPKGDQSPAAQVSSGTVLQGSLQDATKIQELTQNIHVLTVEIEHVGVETLRQLESRGVTVRPDSNVLSIIQDKYLQKQHFLNAGIALPPFMETPSVAAIRQAAQVLGLPLMLKSRKGAYDGRGNAVLQSLQDIPTALSKLGIQLPTNNDDTTTADNNVVLDLYAEGWIRFQCEVAVMVVRSSHGQTLAYPAVHAIQQDSICRVVVAPAPHLSPTLLRQCQTTAKAAIDSLGDGAAGVFGVELFVTDNAVLLNEVAPRPHNTGHYTQDACAVSQFENHLRAVCGMPLGQTDMIVEAAAMINVLGAASGTMQDTLKSSNAALPVPRATVHWYGKESCSPGRKMGHINLTANSLGELERPLHKLMEIEGIPLSVLQISNNNNNKSSPTVNTCPLVGIIMGSQSDLPTMDAAVSILKRFDIPYEVDIVSAHRTPDKLVQYARNAESRGMRVIIAGAGGAAHLPGMVASMTPLPVIGVPVKTSTLSGVDSLYSIVQMPRGIPVATVAIGNAQNAGLLAVRMLSTSRASLRAKMVDYQDELTDMVNGMSDKLLDIGSDAFLEQMDNKNKSVNV